MRFCLYCSDNQKYYYDNQLNRVYDCFGNLLDFSTEFNAYYSKVKNSQLSRKDIEYFEYHAECLIRKNKKVFNPEFIQRLEITLGYKCNYRCKYCIQSEHHFDTSDFDFRLFCDRFEKSGLIDQINDIKFTGGEPFVYFDRLKKYVAYFREQLGFNGRLQLVTNGELFTKEKLEFCLKNKIQVLFSHDAFAQKYYRNNVDYLENKEKRAIVIEQLKAEQDTFGYSNSGLINFVINPKVYTLQSALDFFNEKLYLGVPVLVGLITKCDTATEFILDEWTEEHLDATVNSLVYAMTCSKDDIYYNYYTKLREVLDRLLYRMVNSLPASVQLSRCPMQFSSKALAVDYNGNAISCWSSIKDNDIVEGSIDNPHNIQYHFKSIKDYPECYACPYVIACGCACPVLKYKDHKIRCKSITPLVKAEMLAAFSILLKKRVKEIFPCDQ